jgi:aromatic ring-opening dioxygenase catalytic subunit (LigB family)
MAEIVGCVALSHAPQLLMPPEKWHEVPSRVKELGSERSELAAELTLEVKQAKMQRCKDAMGYLRVKLDNWAPDVILLMGDDQRENIFEDNTPPFVVYIADSFDATLHFRYLGESPMAQKTKYKAHPAAAANIIDYLMESGFDPAWSKKPRYEAGFGHAFGRPLHFLVPDARYPVIPILINTFYPPAPSAKRCLEFGKALASAVRRCKEVDRVVVMGSGGLSHVRIDERLDRDFIKALERHDNEYLASMPSSVLVEGTSELRNWIATAALTSRGATMVDYVPCYRTMTGIGCAMGFAYWEQ